jgi:hypothetical protein
MFAFAVALTNNHKLLRELLVLELDLENDIMVDGYKAFVCILCIKSSIQSKFASNHTQEKILLPENFKFVLFLLGLNSKYTKSQAARLDLGWWITSPEMNCYE